MIRVPYRVRPDDLEGGCNRFVRERLQRLRSVPGQGGADQLHRAEPHRRGERQVLKGYKVITNGRMGC